MHKNQGWNADPLKEFRWGNITPDGVVFADELAGSQGVDVLLIKQSDQTMEDLQVAENWIRCNRDVVSIVYQDMRPEDEEKLKLYQKVLEKELSPEEKIAKLRDVVENGFNWVGKIQVDAFSASAVVKVYDALSEKNKVAYARMPLVKMVEIAFQLCK